MVAWGLERNGLGFGRGAMITRELPNTEDLSALAERKDPRLADRTWVDHVSRQLARHTRVMHDHNFAHNDLKWRNLLVDDKATLFFIDCPTGDFWRGCRALMLRHRLIKDLACLDKVAKYHLSATQRLRFYLQYRGHQRLDSRDKRRIREVVSFFEGRE